VIRLGPTSSGVADYLELGRVVDPREDLLDLGKDRILEQVFTTIPALQDRQVAQDDDRPVTHFERQVGPDRFHRRPADTAFHRSGLLPDAGLDETQQVCWNLPVRAIVSPSIALTFSRAALLRPVCGL
jgi:hypothetical protein